MSTNKNISIEQISGELDKIFADFMHSSFEQRQQAIQAGAEVFKNAVESATPKDTGEMSRSWEIKDKYKDRRYVGNTKTVNGKGKDGRYREGIPLSNILEYTEGGKHYGFIRKTYDQVEPQIFDAIKNKLSNGGK
ncbi:MAG: HK97 gp10 family phage protein [Clostridia bacterium]|nr:HK97 gp10 family phage protein [Clostridia bacterium]